MKSKSGKLSQWTQFSEHFSGTSRHKAGRQAPLVNSLRQLTYRSTPASCLDATRGNTTEYFLWGHHNNSSVLLQEKFQAVYNSR